MSFVICNHCKYQTYCTFAPNGKVRECDEYEDQDSAPSYEWDLQKLLTLYFTPDGQPVERQDKHEPPDG